MRVRRLWWWQRQPNDGPIKWLLLNLFNLFAHLIWLLFVCKENSYHPASKCPLKLGIFFVRPNQQLGIHMFFQFIAVHNKIQSAIKGTNKKYPILPISTLFLKSSGKEKSDPIILKEPIKHTSSSTCWIPQLPTQPQDLDIKSVFTKTWDGQETPSIQKKHNRSPTPVKIGRFCPKRERERYIITQWPKHHVHEVKSAIAF